MVASSEQSSSHPIAESILNEARKRSLTLITPKKVEEIAGQGISSIIENKEILCGKISLLTSKGIEISPNITNDFGTTVYCSIAVSYTHLSMISFPAITALNGTPPAIDFAVDKISGAHPASFQYSDANILPVRQKPD